MEKIIIKVRLADWHTDAYDAKEKYTKYTMIEAFAMLEYEIEYEDDSYSRKSRSQKKRESTALQVMGEELTALGDGALQDMGLPDELLQAIIDWKNFPTHEAKRRQMQYIGKLMREVDDIDALQELIDVRKQGHEAQTALLHKAEDIRRQLLDPKQKDDTLNVLMEENAKVDKAKILHLVEGSLSANKKNASRMSKELFRYLREVIVSNK